MLHLKNTTIQNRFKRKRLDLQHVIPMHAVTNKQVVPFLEELLSLPASKESVLFSLGLRMLDSNIGEAAKDFLTEYNQPLVAVPPIPADQFDILGIAYQYLNSKTENLIRGSFYTSFSTARDFVLDIKLDPGQVIFDPACGSGAFLFASNAAPTEIYGIDSDPIAIMLAKFNYFKKFPHGMAPNLICQDFFDWFYNNKNLRFDFIVGNPPFGANLENAVALSEHVTSGESFALFIEYSSYLLKDQGLLRFLVPDALLNVKRHADVRSFILDKTNLLRIKRYKRRFTGLMSDVLLLELARGHTTSVTFEAEDTNTVPAAVLRSLKNKVFANLDEVDLSILQRVREKKAFDLSQSIFGLGIVTGNNRSKLLQTYEPGSEPIWTGKEVQKYQLLPPRNYIFFDRARLQQVAPDSLYRAPVKLVYRVISTTLRVAPDLDGRLTTNSANLLVPVVPGFDPYAVMALLNSALYSFLHTKLNGGVNKVGKENLISLPFPKITQKQSDRLSELASHPVTDSDQQELDSMICMEIFALTKVQMKHVEANVLLDRSS